LLARVITANGLIRVAAAASGQLFAFLAAERFGHRQGSGALLVGALGAVFFATELLGAPFGGRMADRFGYQRILRTGPLFGVGAALLAITSAFQGLDPAVFAAVLFLARLNEGASAAFAVPTTLAIVAHETDAEPVRRMRVMGVFEITSVAGMIAGFVVAGFAWDAFRSAAFLIVAAIYASAWLIVGPSPFTAIHRSELPSILAAARGVAARKGAVAFAVSWLAVNAVIGVWIQQAPFLLRLPHRLTGQVLVGGYTGSTIGLVFGVWGVAFLIGIVLWSVFGARLPRRRVLTIALVAMLGVTVTLGLVNHGAPTALLILTALLVIVESGYTPAAFSELADLSEPLAESRGAVLGLYSLILAGGQLAGNLIGAPFAARWQMDGILLLTALLAVLSLAAVARLPTHRAEVAVGNNPRRQPY
jgi:MFS family permease